jgi:hypothetical protein
MVDLNRFKIAPDYQTGSEGLARRLVKQGVPSTDTVLGMALNHMQVEAMNMQEPLRTEREATMRRLQETAVAIDKLNLAITEAVRDQVRGLGRHVSTEWMACAKQVAEIDGGTVFKNEREILRAAGLRSFTFLGTVYEPDKAALQPVTTKAVYVPRAVYTALRWLATRRAPFKHPVRYNHHSLR